MSFLLIYTKRHRDEPDTLHHSYEAFRCRAEAEVMYEALKAGSNVLGMDWLQFELHSAHICPVINSTDYTPVFLMPLAQKQLHDHRQRLYEAFDNGDREEFQRIKQELQA